MKLLFVILLIPLFCFSQIPKDLPIDSAKYIKDSIKMDSLIEVRAERKYIKDSIHKDSLMKVAAFKADDRIQARLKDLSGSTITNENVDSFIATQPLGTGTIQYYNGITLDSLPSPNDVLITGEQQGLMILNVSYQGNVIHIECEHCYALTKDNNLEIHFEK